MNMITSDGWELIRHFEGLYLNAYYDNAIRPGFPHGTPTIGYGRIHYDDLSPVKIGDTCTVAQANQWLAEDVELDGAHFVRAWVKTPLKDCQYSALTSFCFNRGAGRFRQLLANGNILMHIQDFSYAGDPPKRMEGLARRRAAEFLMYSGKDWHLVDTEEKFKAWEANG